MFAVVNLITKSGNAIDGRKVEARTGSYGTREVIGRIGKEFNNGLDLTVSGQRGDVNGQDLYFPEYDDPETNNGVARGLDWDENYSVFTHATYGAFTLQGKYASREKGIPTGAYETEFNDRRAKTLDEFSFVELRYEDNLSGDKTLNLGSSYNHSLLSRC